MCEVRCSAKASVLFFRMLGAHLGTNRVKRQAHSSNKTLSGELRSFTQNGRLIPEPRGLGAAPLPRCPAGSGAGLRGLACLSGSGSATAMENAAC